MESSPPNTLRRRIPNNPSTSIDTASEAKFDLSPHPNPPATSDPYDPYAGQHTIVADLWLRSRLISDTPKVYRGEGEDRPVTFRNIVLALSLARLLACRFVLLFVRGIEWRMVVYVAGALTAGLLPTIKIWAASALLDLVQASLDRGTVDTYEVGRVAIISILSAIGDDIIKLFLHENDEIVKLSQDAYSILEPAYLRTQLSLTIPSLWSPYISALMHEAGIITGFEFFSTPADYLYGSTGLACFSGPFDALQVFIDLMVDILSLISQAYLMYKTLSKGSVIEIGCSTLLLISLSAASSILRTIGPMSYPKADPHYDKEMRRLVNVKAQVRALGRQSEHKQETILFGLKEWIIEKWVQVQADLARNKRASRNRNKELSLGLKIGEESLQTSFYVMLALRLLPTSLSFGDIRLYQRITESMLESVSELSEDAYKVFQRIFYIAAFMESMKLQTDTPSLDYSSSQAMAVESLNYESHRNNKGMNLIVSNLNFRYPGSSKDVFHNINLTIPAGSTLAIVGVNGGGKSTLVKILLGLYHQQSGSVLLNDLPISSFDAGTLHRRQSALFQDFGKYALTVRENVGMGLIEKIDDGIWVREAIDRGGAGAILGKVGMEGQVSLNPILDPDASESEEDMSEEKPKGGILFKAGQLFSKTMAGLGIIDHHEVLNPNRDVDDDDSNEEKSSNFKSTASSSQATNLSGGEWQRLALSRAFMRASEADLVVFDEPSASLDPKAEAELFERIHSLSHMNGRSCTTIYISHRFSTVRKADQIAVLDNGTIIECGTHTELMRLNGQYAELFTLQQSGFVEQ